MTKCSSNKKRQCQRQDGKNAFDVLMTKTRKGVIRKSRFVLCPAGCGKHVSENCMDSHLDTCLLVTNAATRTKSKVMPPSVPTSPEKTLMQDSTTDSEAPHPTLPNTNVFAHMMKQSLEQLPVKHRFHLDLNGTPSWTSDATQQAKRGGIEWSDSVLLKSEKDNRASPPKDVLLTISSSFPSADKMPRMVQYHSRLSIPVLKSVLQKSIRRKRPLPAVRIAMELIDKSLQDLLRRLSIIILEDSFLHVHLPLLVWLMVAHSKNFVIPRVLLCRVLEIVYEVASCPWTDPLRDGPNDVESSTTATESTSCDNSHTITRDTAFVSNERYLSSLPLETDCDVVIRSLLLRMNYGGMAGDMTMLDKYFTLWRSRFFDLPLVPPNTAKRLCSFAQHLSIPDKLKWSQVPQLIHQSAKCQAMQHVSPLCKKNGLNKLQLSDVCLQGVDFHCSSVLDCIVHDSNLYAVCRQQFPCKEPTREHIMGMLKECMWKFSSGVSLKCPLQGGPSATMTLRDGQMKEVWDQHLRIPVEAFMKTYVQERLAR